MNNENTLLFQTTEPFETGIGFHNIGSGILRYSHTATIEKVERHYGQRCGHLPYNANTLGVLIHEPDDRTVRQFDYLSTIIGKQIQVMTRDDIKKIHDTTKPLIVPYINVPESEAYIESLNAVSWGLPGPMTHVLKNKAEFYKLITDLQIPGFVCPDYTIIPLRETVSQTKIFLSTIKALYDEHELTGSYPLGVMMRASDEDGNYGCALAYEDKGNILVVPDGDAVNSKTFPTWDEALAYSAYILGNAMNPHKEPRIVVSRYIDLLDSPGISLVFLEGYVDSLGWNGQLQKPGSKACVGTSSYIPKTEKLKKLQNTHEQQTADIFELFLRAVATFLGYDFNKLRGLANIDIMLPGPLEQQLMQKRGKIVPFYIAECNPRFTNYTDAISLIICATGRDQTVRNMKAVIKEGISTIDKYILPEGLDPELVRDEISKRDTILKKEGTRIICRMADNPMGLIFAGDIAKAENEMEHIVAVVKKQTESNE